MTRLPESALPSGVLNMYKPIGLTSHDVVARVRRLLNTKKVGHLGTLDPLAEGVLPLCIGSCTRLIDYFPSGKSYEAELVFGKISETLDREGPITVVDPAPNIDLNDLQHVLQRFRGTIQQKVPMHSAVHVNGKRLYSLARKGETLAPQDVPSREVIIYTLELLDFSPNALLGPTLKLAVQCSSGTYIRALARDIGGAMGCGAYMSALLRTHHGGFTLDNAVSLEALAGLSNARDVLLSPIGFLALKKAQCVAPECLPFLANGKRLPLQVLKPEDDLEAAFGSGFGQDFKALYLVTYSECSVPIAVVRLEIDGWQPVKVFIPEAVLGQEFA
jgi:tRNA pseudouridine55 synthase